MLSLIIYQNMIFTITSQNAGIIIFPVIDGCTQQLYQSDIAISIFIRLTKLYWLIDILSRNIKFIINNMPDIGIILTD